MAGAVAYQHVVQALQFDMMKADDGGVELDDLQVIERAELVDLPLRVTLQLTQILAHGLQVFL